MIVSRRLEELRLNPFEAARSVDLERSFINDILIEKKSTVRGKNLHKLATALQMDVIELLDEPQSQDISGTDEAPGLGPVSGQSSKDPIVELDVPAPMSSDQSRFDAPVRSDNQLEEDSTGGKWTIPDSYLAASGMTAARTQILVIDGPSMSPDLEPDDRVLIDLDDTNPGRDGIFAIWDSAAKTIIVKHVQVLRETEPPRIRCISANKTYPCFELVLDGKTRIVGRVRRRITSV